MSPTDKAKELRDFSKWFERRSKEVLAELMREALAESPDEAREAAADAVNAMEGCLNDFFEPAMIMALADYEPEPWEGEDMRREHGTYDATSIYGRVA